VPLVIPQLCRRGRETNRINLSGGGKCFEGVMEQTNKGRNREREQIDRSRNRVRARVDSAYVDQEARDRADDALAQSASHEILCNERWETQRSAMVRVEGSMVRIEKSISEKIGRIPAAIIAAMGTVIGFLAARVFPV
jgi:hypothetical protein